MKLRATGSPLIFLFPLHRKSQPQLQLNRSPLATPIVVGFGAVISHADVCSHTPYPESLKMPGRDMKRLFPDCWQEGNSVEWWGGCLKYLTARRPWCNEEVLFCFIFDAGKLQRYTALPFKSQRCHSRWEFAVNQCMIFSKGDYDWGRKDRECLHGNRWRGKGLIYAANYCLIYGSEELQFKNFPC